MRGGVRMRQTATNAAAKDATSIQYATAMLQRAMTRPASSEPNTIDSWKTVWFRAIAAWMWRRSTSVGASDARVGLSSAEKHAPAAVRTYKSGTDASSSCVAMASESDTAARPTWVMSSSRRRSTASAITPAKSESRSSGTAWNRPMSPTANEEPVSTKTWYGSATSRSWLPLIDTS